MRCGEFLRVISSCSDVRVDVGVVPGVSIPGCCDCARSEECVAMLPTAMATLVTSCRRVRPSWDEARYCGAEAVFTCMFPPRICWLSPRHRNTRTNYVQDHLFVRHGDGDG